MTYDDLKNELLKYSNEIKGQTAKTPSFVDIKNKIRQAYDAIGRGLLRLGESVQRVMLPLLALGDCVS